MKEYCKNFFKLEFEINLSYTNRLKHEKITSNDCLSQMSRKHEFINLYDFDEFVFPRTMNASSKPLFSCNDKKSLCSSKPFDSKKTDSGTSHFYNHLNSLIEEYSKGRNRSLLLSIEVKHVLYILPNDVEKKLFQDIGVILDRINSTSFPVSIFLGDAPNSTLGQIYTIEKNDIEYANMIYNSYTNINNCANNWLINSRLDKMFQRYVYLITESSQRFPKCIYYYNNFKFVNAHGATDYKPKTWSFTPSVFDGHMLPHFRVGYGRYFRNLTSSIRKLNIDFEYLLFIMKNFTNYCEY